MRNLIIITQEQFGYHIDTYYYCKYLKNSFELVYICWDHGLQKVKLNGVRVKYVNRRGNFLFRSLRFLLVSIQQIDDKQSIIFSKYFNGVSTALRLFKPKNNFVLDIRTGSICENFLVRKFQDSMLKFETNFFKNITVISKRLSENLNISQKAHILPVGADIISANEKSFKCLNLLYVGTLFNRKIETTIHGFKIFYDEYKGKIKISYTIIGDGPKTEKEVLKELVTKYGLSEIVNVTGSIPHTHLKPWFDSANVGVSYVPLTNYYDCQPVTKTFEYLLSGIPVIATKTSENRKVLTQENGILVGDSAKDFYFGLRTIFNKRHLFNSTKIRNMAKDYTWTNIILTNMKGYFERIILL